VEPHYPKAGNGRQPAGLSIMLRTYFLQQWFGFSDPGMEEAFYDSPALWRFAGVDLDVAAAPDETTILRFRHLLEKHELCGQSSRCWAFSPISVYAPSTCCCAERAERQAFPRAK
jgi:IS5 family transposase